MTARHLRHRGRLRVLAVVSVLLGGTACDVPRDPEGTLDRVRGGTLRVGITEAPPWVTRHGESVGGTEADLIRRFARSVGADLEWSWGPVADHMEALKRYELDLVAGGLTRDTPWTAHVGLTAPFADGRHVMAVPPGENGFLAALDDVLHGANLPDVPPPTGGAP